MKPLACQFLSRRTSLFTESLVGFPSHLLVLRVSPEMTIT